MACSSCAPARWITWHESALSFGAALAIAELIPPAPWLPPMMSSVVRPGFNPNAASAAVLCMGRFSADRRGVPVTSHFAFGKWGAHS